MGKERKMIGRGEAKKEEERRKAVKRSEEKSG